MRLIDTHCHIDGPQFDEDRDAVVERAREAGVVAMLNVGTGDPHTGEIARAVAVAEKYDNVFAAVGVHPHDAKLYDDAAEAHLIDLVKSSEKVIAWGEIGLDYYYDHSPRDVQREVFRRQIRKAIELGLPVIIHSRDADDETVEILTNEFGRSGDTPLRMSAKHESDLAGRAGDADTSVRVPGVMHCFGGTAKMAQVLLEVGFYISFAGNITFKKADKLREAARIVPLDRLLVETDCPYLTPVPFRGKRNEPAMVVHTAKFLADLYGVSFETVAERTTQNFLDLFAVSPAAN
ncbi:MAG: TatD family hydrolase [Acidobacteria bacterium]|nr:TatD family hydrolase [Acidobacteriota bacterium]